MKITVNSAEVEKYLGIWKTLENYVVQESAVTDLFQNRYQKNSDLKGVLIKVCVLNEFYSTQILDTTSVAKHILGLNIDKSLSEGDLDLVAKIGKIELSGKKRNNYSFATKYCSHHNPDTFPIYDSFVDNMLWTINKQYEFHKFKRKELKEYPKFVETLYTFQVHFKLSSYSIKQIDQFLWLLGKDKANLL